jgi:hypothetical protein
VRVTSGIQNSECARVRERERECERERGGGGGRRGRQNRAHCSAKGESQCQSEPVSSSGRPTRPITVNALNASESNLGDSFSRRTSQRSLTRIGTVIFARQIKNPLCQPSRVVQSALMTWRGLNINGHPGFTVPGVSPPCLDTGLTSEGISPERTRRCVLPENEALGLPRADCAKAKGREVHRSANSRSTIKRRRAADLIIDGPIAYYLFRGASSIPVH